MSSESKPAVIPPGSTIGILGSGQLGKMMAIQAKHMGYRVHILSPGLDTPAGQVADLEVQASFTDLDAIDAFARRVSVVTVETENIPLPTLETAGEICPAYPGRSALEVCQNRLKEKQFLGDSSVPTCEYRIVNSRDELRQACDELMPGILKTTTGGYDGKGQFKIQSPDDIEPAWEAIGGENLILEQFIDYDFEFSVVGVRNSAGVMTAYSSIRNEHVNGILDVSISPGGLPADQESAAREICFEIMSRLDSVGVLTIEFFRKQDEIYVNEMAPRPHNSGHLTIEGHVTCQFEQHIRAICGMAPGSTRQHQPVAMANLLGQVWQDGQNPHWHLALEVPDTKLHLYGKEEPRKDRKMGHLTSLAESVEQAQGNVVSARKLLNSDVAGDSTDQPAAGSEQESSLSR
ncbi:MAG: 5-(carboxyamino)imidazole ribonucleotide synthase [Planctomycetota bacterium]